ncbi:MAG TPA: asparagine synthase (glutamine-hydrolyzing) [Pyrinomonadaceae bacterium]|jgi:asparagine synthase (glutamine-hydrolysing)|nr:asparagine synthase (glutamine-hydrolyzing) [Pyrinomonadaceae bacterium]
MCGIIGFLNTTRHRQPADEMQATARRMSDTLLHRGPDDEGSWVDASAGLAFGFRRLSIIDLSPEGHQPMTSMDGRYVIIFNGEIYNFRELRRELEASGHRFRGHSDTEVMLAAFSQWGFEQGVKRLNGMFALALWDKRERVLHLTRDRIGEKPLYYGLVGGTFLFGSELKALKAHPSFRAEINRDALALFLRYNYIPAPYSIYKDIQKLPPGTYLSLQAESISSGSSAAGQSVPLPRAYWSAREVAEAGVAAPFEGTESEAVAELETLLGDAVGLRMVADVPLGAFLSGGVDSSTVVALMQAQSERPVRTFSIGFTEEAYDEARHARAVAAHLKTDHTELYVTPEDAMAVIPRLPALYDEPFSDSSQIPTFLVSQLARRHVTVSLSGDGGDELFAGYNRYLLGESVWNKIGWMPKASRAVAAGALTTVSPRAWDRAFTGLLKPFLPSRLHQRTPGDRLHKLAEILTVHDPEAMYMNLVSHWKQPARLVKGAAEPTTTLTDTAQWANLPSFIQRMMYLDTVTYLPDDILVKVDRASMGVSLEARVPFLDHRVVEFSWRMPLSWKIRDGESKWPLRQILYKHVPRDLIERPKMGFGIPIGEWLRGPLRDWAEALLGEKRLKEEGFLNPQPVRQKWTEHLGRGHNWQYYIWDVLMFQGWLERERAI